MDHMRILGTEPSPVILSQNSLKSWKVMPVLKTLLPYIYLTQNEKTFINLRSMCT